MKPIIGITTFGPGLTGCGCGNRTLPSFWIPDGYIAKIVDAGGLPVLLPPSPGLVVTDILANMNGIIVSGGGDVCPRAYKAMLTKEEEEKCRGIDLERDSFELEVARVCVMYGIPYFGICRGMQILNIALGGTLHLDLSDAKIDTSAHRNTEYGGCTEHQVCIVNSSRLRDIVGSDDLAVMSNHHQCVNILGNGLNVSGISYDGIVEAIEYKNNDLIFGVQWHPEVDGTENKKNAMLFQNFISGCEKT